MAQSGNITSQNHSASMSLWTKQCKAETWSTAEATPADNGMPRVVFYIVWVTHLKCVQISYKWPHVFYIVWVTHHKCVQISYKYLHPQWRDSYAIIKYADQGHIIEQNLKCTVIIKHLLYNIGTYVEADSLDWEFQNVLHKYMHAHHWQK